LSGQIMSLQFPVEHAFETAEKDYQKYKTRVRFFGLMLLLGYGSAVYGFIALAYYTEFLSLARIIVAIGGILAVPSLVALAFTYNKLEGVFSSMEERTLHFLKPAVSKMADFASTGKIEYRNDAVKNLRKTADVIDRWNGGNLRFLSENVGKKIETFATGFRTKVIPWVAKATKEQASSWHGILSQMQASLLYLNELNLDDWNVTLGRMQPGESEHRYRPYVRTMSIHALYVGGALTFAYVNFLTWINTDKSAAVNAFYAVLAFLLTPYGTYVAQKLLSGKGKPNPRKEEV